MKCREFVVQIPCQNKVLTRENIKMFSHIAHSLWQGFIPTLTTGEAGKFCEEKRG